MHERYTTKNVALPTEGVDRNAAVVGYGCRIQVALPTEGVDRNLGHSRGIRIGAGRPPHGGRG